MTGNRNSDFNLANEKAGFSQKGKSPDENYVWHHLGDFNPETGEYIMQLVKVDAHKATVPHKGSCGQYDDYNGTKIYNPPKKKTGRRKNN